MKKIMFNDKYGLTDAVLQGRKTMTRRIIADNDEIDAMLYARGSVEKKMEYLLGKSRYKIGEVVAVAQSYKSIHKAMMSGDYGDSKYDAFRSAFVAGTKGWTNKKFVRADLMPYRIKITDIKVEKLQDISDEDVYKEGFRKEAVNNGWGNAAWHWEAMLIYTDNLGRYKEIRSESLKEAFSFLIDKVSGYGTWMSNPWCYAYTFELVGQHATKLVKSTRL